LGGGGGCGRGCGGWTRQSSGSVRLTNGGSRRDKQTCKNSLLQRSLSLTTKYKVSKIFWAHLIGRGRRYCHSCCPQERGREGGRWWLEGCRGVSASVDSLSVCMMGICRFDRLTNDPFLSL